MENNIDINQYIQFDDLLIQIIKQMKERKENEEEEEKENENG